MRRAVLTAIVASAALAGCGGSRSGPPTPTLPDSVAGTARHAATATSGALDSGFGTGGKVVTNINPNSVAAVAVQPDGKIVVAATLDDFRIATEVFAVVRYLADGRLDASFGSGGIVRTAFSISTNTARGLTIQPDGKIVVVGETDDTAGGHVAIARYTAGGGLDSSFGSGGKVVTSFLGHRDFANVALLQPDGKLIVGGFAGSGDEDEVQSPTALARYTTNGALDPAFGNGGIVLAKIFGPVNALALESDGSILAAGVQAIGSGINTVARFSANGTLEPIALTGSFSAFGANANLAFQPDGRVVFGGSTGENGFRHDVDVKLIRFTVGGGVDAAFQRPVFDFEGEGPNALKNVVQAVAIAPSGKIVAGGFSQTSVGDDFGIARFNANGTLDAAFGTGGLVTTRFFGNEIVDAIAIQGDGKIVAAGTTSNNPSGTIGIALARYLGP